MTYIIRSWRELQKAELISREDFFVDRGGYFFGDFWAISHLKSWLSSRNNAARSVDILDDGWFFFHLLYGVSTISSR